jgi:hypothetical protein
MRSAMQHLVEGSSRAPHWKRAFVASLSAEWKEQRIASI